MPTPPRTAIIFSVLLTCLLSLVAYQSFAAHYPFYFMWDMDLTYVFDTILIQSGLLPDHFNHPGFGAYLLFKWSDSINYFLGTVPVYDLNSLRSALHPVLAIIPTIDFFRAHSPYIAAITTSLLFFFFYSKESNLRPWQILLLAANLILLPSFFYQSTMIRSELFAILFWVIAAICTIKATKSQNSQTAWLTLSGIFAGLSYLTKIQVLLLLPVLFVIFRLHFSTVNNQLQATKLSKLAAFIAFFFPILVIASGFRSIHGEAFTDKFPINLVGISFAIIPILLFLWQKKWIPCPAVIASELNWPIIFLFGFAISFLFHFLLFPSDPNLSFKYLLINAKMVFYRNNYQTIDWLPYAWQNIKSISLYNPIAIGSGVISFVIAFFSTKNPKDRLYLLLGCGLTFSILSIGIRPILRDTLWAEIILTIWILLNLLPALNGNNLVLKGLATIILILLPISHVFTMQKLPIRIQSAYANYGWQPEKVFDGMFVYRQMQYAEIMSRAYPNHSRQKTTALQNLNSAGMILDTANFVIPAQKSLWQKVSVVAKDFPVWHKDPAWKIDDFSSDLNSAFTVDPNSTSNHCFKNTLSAESEIGKVKCEDQLFLQTRNDIELYIFASESDLKIRDGIANTNLKINLRTPQAKKTLSGFRVLKPIKLDQKNDFLVVVQFKNFNKL